MKKGTPVIIVDDKGRRRAINTHDEPCAIEQGMRVLGGKWTGSILWHLQDGPFRFNDLSRIIPGASKKMLTERLRHLEDHDMVLREVMNTAPVSVQYSLTDRGRTALGFLDALRQWTETHVGASSCPVETPLVESPLVAEPHDG